MALLYLIAGEPSGDYLGGRLMRVLRAVNPHIVIEGIGGPQMTGQGLKSQFPMQELSVMGFLEVLPHIRNLKQRLHQTAEDIRAKRPDAVVTIDSPGFTFRLARLLKGSGIPLIHYVAPTVWAYKPERAKTVAELFDLLLVLFPFEPPYFEAVGAPCRFVGHAIVEEWREKPDAGGFRRAYGIEEKQPLICLLPGSRVGELKRHLPVFRNALTQVASQRSGIKAMVLCLPHTRDLVTEETRNWPVPVTVISDQAERKAALAASDAALSKSGTISLELALADTPMITTYRVNPVSAWLLRRMLKSSYVNLINILVGKPVVPELLQERCNADELAVAMVALLENGGAEQRVAFAQAREAIGMEWPATPSMRAAEAVMEAVPALRG